MMNAVPVMWWRQNFWPIIQGFLALPIYWGKILHALIVRGRKECRYAYVLALSVCLTHMCVGSLKLAFVLLHMVVESAH